MGTFFPFIVFVGYLLLLAAVIFFLNRRKKGFSEGFNTWIYALSIPASYLTGWAFLGMPNVLIQDHFGFLGYYLGIIVFSLLFPFLLERIYQVIERYHVNDIISFILLRYQRNKTLSRVLLSVILLVTLPYLALNIKSLGVLVQGASEGFSGWGFLILALFLIFIFVFYIREWKGITVVAIQGVIMLVCIIAVGAFVAYGVFDSPEEIFSTLKERGYSDRLGMGPLNHFVNSWSAQVLIAVFSFIFLPRQFSIISQGINLARRKKIFKTAVSLIVFFVFLNLMISLVGGGILAYVEKNSFSTSVLKQFHENPVFYFVQSYGNGTLSLLFLVGGFSFVLSTLNQQLIALSDILKKHLRFEIGIGLVSLILASAFLAFFLKDVYLEKIGVLCLVGYFQLAIPILGGFFWERGNARGAIVGLLAGILIWLGMGWVHFLGSPENFVSGQPILNLKESGWALDYFPFHWGDGTSYLWRCLIYASLFNFIFYVLFSLSAKTGDPVTRVYLGQKQDTDMVSKDFEEILSYFDYNAELIHIFSFLYNNQELQFTRGELQDYIKLKLMDKDLELLKNKKLILENKEKTYGINPAIKDQLDLEAFFSRYSSFKYFLDKVSLSYRESKKEIETKLTQMQILYKIYLKIGSLNKKKDFFRQLTRILPLHYPEIVRIEYEKGEKSRELFQSKETYELDPVHFKINLGDSYLALMLKKDFKMEDFFVLEPILILAYRVVHHIEKLQNYALRLKNLDTIRTHFIANISHELRTPLVPLKGYLAILREHPGLKTMPEALEMIKTMELSYKRLENLIENLILFKEASFDFFNVQTVNLLELLFSVIMELKDKMESRGIQLIFFEKEFEGIEIQGDREKLKLALIQILDNSIKFNQYEGKIKIRIRESEEQIQISIRDTGVGMTPDIRKRIFEAFYQGDADVTRHYEGAGLGLSIVKKIVVLHGGKIQIQSLKNRGTRVLVTLPKNSSNLG